VLTGNRGAVALRRTAAAPVMKAAPFKVGGMVEVISGDDKGETGKIISIDLKKGKLMVEGINMQSKHMKPMKEGESGRIMKREGPIHMSNVKMSDAPAPAPAAAE